MRFQRCECLLESRVDFLVEAGEVAHHADADAFQAVGVEKAGVVDGGAVA